MTLENLAHSGRDSWGEDSVGDGVPVSDEDWFWTIWWNHDLHLRIRLKIFIANDNERGLGWKVLVREMVRLTLCRRGGDYLVRSVDNRRK